MKIMGIDEAGRGCVIGPMVICGVVCMEADEELLREINVKDSKKLDRPKREKMAEKIKGVIKNYTILEVQPFEIDCENINRIGKKKIIELIERHAPSRVYLDVPVNSRGIREYNNGIRGSFADRDLEVVGENRADETYPVVSAASILAKVHRDGVIEKLKESYEDFGSGYPSDSRTIEFLKRYYEANGGFPEGIVRMKWRTLNDIKQADLFDGE